MPKSGLLQVKLFVFMAGLMASANALACPDGTVQMDECFCYKVLSDSILKREVGTSQSFEIDTSAPPVPAENAPGYCTGKDEAPKTPAPAAPLPVVVAPPPPPPPPAPAQPPPQPCPAGFRPIGNCDCVENVDANARIKPRPGAPEMCKVFEKNRKTSAPNQLPSALGLKAPVRADAMPLSHCDWFFVRPGACECAHSARQPGAIPSTPENLKRCSEEYAKGHGGKGFEYQISGPAAPLNR